MTTIARPIPRQGDLEPRLTAVHRRFLHFENGIHHLLVKHSVTALRIALGLVFLGFGVLKYFPDVSPAQAIVERTTHVLFLGLIPGFVSIKIIATLECFIGLCLLTHRWMRLCVWLLAFEFVGILSPIFLFPGSLFSGPDHAPTLLGQYCLKDIILVAAGLVVAAVSFRGGRLVRGDLPPNVHRLDDEVIGDPEHRLRLVLDSLQDPGRVPELCESHHLTEGELHLWRDAVLSAATLSLSDPALLDAEADRKARAEAASAPAPKTLGPVLTIATLLLLRGRH